MACYEITMQTVNWGNAQVSKMMSIRKAAEETGLTYVLIKELCDTGPIAYLRSGRKYLVNFDSLLELSHNGEGENVKYDRRNNQRVCRKTENRQGLCGGIQKA